MTSNIHYVYFIQQTDKFQSDGNALLKIGVSNQVNERLRALQVSNAYPLAISCTIPCETRNAAFLLEKKLHKIASNIGRKMNGEWFQYVSLNKLLKIAEDTVATSNEKSGIITEDIKFFKTNNTKKDHKTLFPN